MKTLIALAVAAAFVRTHRRPDEAVVSVEAAA